MSRQGYVCEVDPELPPTVKVKHWPGIAWRCWGWHLEPVERWQEDDEDETKRSGKVVVVMVGDDKEHLVDPDDIEAIPREAYCGVCGQMGCNHDGLERGAA